MSDDFLSNFDKTHLEEVWDKIELVNDTGEVVAEIEITDEELARIASKCVLDRLYESDFQ